MPPLPVAVVPVLVPGGRRVAQPLVSVACWVLLGCLGSPAAPPAEPADSVDLPKTEQRIFRQTNALRQQQGLDPLARQEALQKAAERFARYMAQHDRYGHTADGRTPAQRAEAAGYAYCIVRENIAYRTDPSDNRAGPLADTFFEGWKESPEHRDNMLAEGVLETAVAVASRQGRTFYAVQLFGRPQSAALQIDLANRSDQTVTVQIASGDAKDSLQLPPGAELQMRRCRATTLSLADSPASIEVRQSRTLRITTTADDRLQIEALPDDPVEADSQRPAGKQAGQENSGRGT